MSFQCYIILKLSNSHFHSRKVDEKKCKCEVQGCQQRGGQQRGGQQRGGKQNPNMLIFLSH